MNNSLYIDKPKQNFREKNDEDNEKEKSLLLRNSSYFSASYVSLLKYFTVYSIKRNYNNMDIKMK